MASKMTWEEARDKLKKFREDHRRRSEEVVDIWENCLQCNRHQLADDVWPIYEQVCVAACDCGRDDIAEDCIKSLRRQFPGSTRVNMLRGMFLESIKDYDAAKKLYEEIEQNEPANTVVRKRKIVMLKEDKNMSEAIKELNKYLKDFMGDVEAWTELCELYLHEHEFAKAAFCMEELIVFNPNNHVYYTKYAEIKYTEGNQENIETARRYFAQALRINKNSMRALYGLFLCSSNLALTKLTNKKDNIRYADWAAKEITDRYQEVENEESEGDGVPIIEHMLKSLSVAAHTT